MSLLCQTLQKGTHAISRTFSARSTERRLNSAYKTHLQSPFLPVSVPFAFSHSFTSSLLLHPRPQHSTPYHNTAGRAKFARSCSDCLLRRFFSMSDRPAVPPTMSTAHKTLIMNTHPQTRNAVNGSSALNTHVVLPNIALPSRPSPYSPWAMSQKSPVYKVRIFFDLLLSVNLTLPPRHSHLRQPTVCTRYDMPFVYTNATTGVSADAK